MQTIANRVKITTAMFATAALAAAAAAGPDVIYSDLSSTAQYTPVNGIRAYTLGTFTCNVGDANLNWNGGTGSPWLAMNAYRMEDGRLEQIGMSWCKNACCAGAGDGCPTGDCNGVGGDHLGVGCLDVYGAFYNGGQTRLGPRSGINAFTGAISANSFRTGNDIYKRLQIRQTDLDPAAHAGAVYFMEGQYIAIDEIPGEAAYNNVSYRPATLSPTSFEFSMISATQTGLPALYAWRDHGNGMNVADPTVTISNLDVPGEGRFVFGCKAIDQQDGTWRYEYAVYNINSDRSGGSFAVRVPIGAEVSGIGFHDVNYHSGEVYDNTDWRGTRVGDRIVWNSPQPFAQNPNSNALRWATMYNFWFVADRPPAASDVSLGLFKPGTPEQVAGTADAPGGCSADISNDAAVDVFDLLSYLDLWFAGSQEAELTDDLPPQVDVFDLLGYLNQWFAQGQGGC
jgi:hypothetical protein